MTLREEQGNARERIARRFDVVARLCAALALGIGLLGLTGWYWRLPLLLSIAPGLVPMKTGTGIGLAVGGVCLFLLCGERPGRVRRIAAGCLAAIVLLGGAAIAANRAWNWYSASDRLLYPAWLALPTHRPISFAAGLVFILFGTSALHLCGGPASIRRAQPIALAGLVIGIMAVAGYVYDLRTFSNVPPYAGMALNTAFGSVLLFTGVLLTQSRNGWASVFVGDGPGNILARRVLPVVVLLPFLSGWLFLTAVRAAYVPLPFGVAASSVFTALLLAVIVWRTVYSVSLSDMAQRVAERARARSEHLKSAVLEAAIDPIVTVDRDGRIVEANAAARRVMGVPARGGHIAGHFVSDEEPPLVFPRTWQSDAPVEQRIETRLRRADGSVFPAELAYGETWPDGRQMLVLYIRDLTEQKATEEQLRQAQKMEAVGQLTGGLAHDFNNLLAIILGNLDLLAERLDAALNEKFLRPAIAAAERGSQLTQRLLAFGRRQSLQPAVVNVNDLVRGMTEMVRRTMGETIAIRAKLAEDVWPTRVDPGQLENALINLALNARDAMPAGGGLTIETGNVFLDEDYAQAHPEAEPGPYVRLAVADTGSGMSAEVAARAFEPFFTTKEVGRGSGLGLSMVYGFIKQSGGHVRLHSELGHGTAVILYLPKSEAREEPDRRDAFDLPRSAGERILVVEDDPDLLEATVGMLEDLGYRTLTARDGAEALEQAEAHPDFNLLFTDLVLPGALNGADVARALRGRRPRLPVVYMSGYAETVLAGQENDDGIPLLRKPFRQAELARLLSDALKTPEELDV
jgi:PAS domain S-box-containing protein